jgi:prolyl 4-hydroxylase
MDLLISHWERNKMNQKQEVWPAGNVYVNHWDSPTYMVSVEDTNLRGGGAGLKQKIWDAAKTTIEQWTGMEQQPTSMYGIRVYTEGAILNPHVDRLPLVSSCIVNVAQDVDEDWILEVYDRQGNAVNVTMAPGDMVLYESGSLIHGRPFPLKGRMYANIFIHFEPTGRKLGDNTLNFLDDLDEFYPPYLLANSPEQPYWRSRNPHGWHKPSPSAPIQQVNSPPGHNAAAHGDIERLEALAKVNRKALHLKDENGWQPIHEAVRGLHKDAVKLLIKHGADKNARTGADGRGGSALNLALAFHHAGGGGDDTSDNSIVNYLLSIGASNIEPEEEL